MRHHPLQRPHRRRKALQFVATMLVALGAVAFAATIALAAQPAGVGVPCGNEAIISGSVSGTSGSASAVCLNKPTEAKNISNMKWELCDGTTGERDFNSPSGSIGPFAVNIKWMTVKSGQTTTAFTGSCTVADRDIQVCRGGVLTTIKSLTRQSADTDPPCVANDTDIEVCRGGVLTTIKSLTRQSADTDPPCVASDPDITVCRAGATTTIKASAKLPTDTDGACPDSGLVPGSADGGGPVDNGDQQSGVDREYDSLAPTGVQQDPAATSGEQVIPTATAGASDGPIAADATTIAGGADETSAVVTPSGSLPYTGLSTLQVALMGVMLLGLGSLAWLVGSAPRSEASLAAA